MSSLVVVNSLDRTSSRVVSIAFVCAPLVVDRLFVDTSTVAAPAAVARLRYALLVFLNTTGGTLDQAAWCASERWDGVKTAQWSVEDEVKLRQKEDAKC